MLKEELILIDGPCGPLETKISIDRHDTLALVCHPHPQHGGTMDNKVVSTIVKAFKKCSINTVRFNYRGVGQSLGSYGDVIGEIDDAKAVLSHCHKHYAPKKIILAGFSFGAFIAAKIAMLEQTSMLISIAPSVVNMNYEEIVDVNCPWLVVHGTSDEVVPFNASCSHFEKKQNVNFVEFKDTTHFFHGKLVDLSETVSAYVNSNT